MIDLALQKWLTSHGTTANPTNGDAQNWLGWCNWVPATPNKTVLIYLEKTNFEINRSYGGAVENRIWFDIRGDSDSEAEVRNKAFEVFDALTALQNLPNKTIILDNGTTIFISLMNFSPPGYVGLDENLRGHWGFQAKILWSLI